ncbi:MAG: bifunctional folylpolyglutamate synthase/dihydrofolate synthase [Treponema sp.]|jgi:dihydrofolate synthase/folylpolyglutamate synthase|nr:bifunctional folylpolyglutamate synthase/dihydrofolate synthase [Treponema sp.]
MGHKFNTSDEVFDWISNFINVERGQKLKKFSVDTMEVLAKIAGHPERCAPSIHVAGSKGKGSVTGMLAAILAAAGYRVGRYMSPHVVNIRERLCLGDVYFDEEIYRSAGDELRHIVEELLPAAANPLFDTSTAEGNKPTFWELLTLLFFLCARKANCNVLVVETGMGGRLDSTNILDPLVSVITLIELEHTAILGDTITAIAGEKAGIIKTNKPLILAKQNDEALELFKKKATEKNSPLYYFPEISELSNVNITPKGTEFTLIQKQSNSSFISIPLPGKVQAENASLAIAAVKTAFPEISEDAINRGLANLKIPGRFENITANDSFPPFIIDGAHTPESLTLCIETFCSLYGEGGVLLFGCAADKDAAAMAKIAYPHFSKIVITTPGTFKLSNPEKVYEAFLHTDAVVELVKDTQEAVRRAIEFAKTSLPILGTGSFYLVSEIRKFAAGDIPFYQ